MKQFHLKILVLFIALLSCNVSWALQPEPENVKELEAEMLKYFGTKDRSSFVSVTNRLKEVCQKSGDDKLFYRTWGNQGIYEAMQQNYTQASAVAKDILQSAREKGSIYGEYMAYHTEAMILLQKRDYVAAENAFLLAVDFHHRHFPNESAGDDLIELLRLASQDKENDKASAFARQILNEKNANPVHTGEAMFFLSQIAFENNDLLVYNYLYDELLLLQDVEGVADKIPLLKVNHAIVNGDNAAALRLADSLDLETRSERKALIYHRMGNDEKAYKYMMRYKKVSDSLMQASHANIIADYHEQVASSREELEQRELEQENNRLRNYLYGSIALFLAIIAIFSIWKSKKMIKRLRSDNMHLVYEKKDAERALTDLNELSFFESKTELPLTLPFKPNDVCDHLAGSTQAHCHRGVVTLFQTELADDFEFQTNDEALKKLLMHLLNYSARFTHKGYIKLSCAEAGDNIRFVVTDTSAGMGGQSGNHIVGMFSEHDNKIRYVGMNFNICQSITRLLHGRIWHDVEFTKGTRFCFEVPKKAVAV